MGASHYIANASKHQFFRPGKFDVDRGSVLLRGLSGHALALLIEGRLGPPKELGCWAGDPLFVLTDDTTPLWGEQLLPDRSIHGFSDYEILSLAYTDVTYPVIAGLCQRDDLSEELVQRGESHDIFLLDLVTVANHYRPAPLLASLINRFGKDLRQRYDQIWKRNVWWQPLAAPWSSNDNE